MSSIVNRFDGSAGKLGLLLFSVFLAGCADSQSSVVSSSYAVPSAAAEKIAARGDSAIKQAAYQSTALSEPDTAPPPRVAALVELKTLTVEAVVELVLARNPNLPQMIAAAQAAAARYPQAIAFDDPMLETTLGPASFGSNTVNPAYRINLSQKIPWPGKRDLRGQRALAEASAASQDVEDIRLQLIASAKEAFYEFFLVDRATAVNERSIQLLTEFRQTAEMRYQTGLVPQQDILQVDVELGRQRERGLLLEQNRQIALARLNTLMNLPPDQPLPPPIEVVPAEGGLPEAQKLRELAVSRRPDLQALRDKIAADRAALAMAEKEFYPDLTPFAMYDRFMGNDSETQPLAVMIGVGVNLPVRTQRRYAALAEAQAQLNARCAELTKQENQVKFELQQAYAQVQQSKSAVRLYDATLLPAAEANVNAAQSAYVTGKISFLSLLEAERNVIGLRDRYYELVAGYFRQLAVLERAVGGPLARETEPAAVVH